MGVCGIRDRLYCYKYFTSCICSFIASVGSVVFVTFVMSVASVVLSYLLYLLGLFFLSHLLCAGSVIFEKHDYN